jgi:hypothetical protein
VQGESQKGRVTRRGKRKNDREVNDPWRSNTGENDEGRWRWDCILGGFNVSNLMGITRRMIDIGKKITFYFLQNV